MKTFERSVAPQRRPADPSWRRGGRARMRPPAPTIAMKAAIASSATGSTVGRYSEMPGVETETARIARIAISDRTSPRRCRPPRARPLPWPRSTRPAGSARRAPCGSRSRAIAATRQRRPPHRGRCRPGTGRARRAHRGTSRPTADADSESSRYCAIVFAAMAGSATFTARSSRCMAPTSPAASSDVRASTVVGASPDCANDR